MSILIKGMEMPECCDECVFMETQDSGFGNDYICSISKEDVDGICDCPLIEVPEDVQPVKWIAFRVRDLDEEEKADHPEWDWILDGELPEDGQRILVNVKFKGHESVQMDEYYDDDGCYLDSGYEIGTEVTHWMPLPEPPREETK